MRSVLLCSFVMLLCCALTASAGHGGRHCRCGGDCQCAPAACGCGDEPIYDARQVTCYKTEFAEVREQKMVPAVKYVPETEYRMVPVTVCETPPVDKCGDTCGKPANCAPAKESCCPPQTTCCLRKAPVTVFRPVCYEKPVDVVRIVEKQIPYTFTCYTPRPCQGCGECGK